MKQNVAIFMCLCSALCMAINIDPKKFRTEECGKNEFSDFKHPGLNARLRCHTITQNPCVIELPLGQVMISYFFSTRPDEDMLHLDIVVPKYEIKDGEREMTTVRKRVTNIGKIPGNKYSENLPRNSTYYARFNFIAEDDYGFKVGDTGYMEIKFIHEYTSESEVYCFRVKFETETGVGREKVYGQTRF